MGKVSPFAASYRPAAAWTSRWAVCVFSASAFVMERYGADSEPSPVASLPDGETYTGTCADAVKARPIAAAAAARLRGIDMDDLLHVGLGRMAVP